MSHGTDLLLPARATNMFSAELLRFLKIAKVRHKFLNSTNIQNIVARMKTKLSVRKLERSYKYQGYPIKMRMTMN